MDEHSILDESEKGTQIVSTLGGDLRGELDREIQRLNSQRMWTLRDGGRVLAHVYVNEDNEVEVDSAGPLVMNLQTTAELHKMLERAATKAQLNMAQAGATYYVNDEGWHTVGPDGRLD